MGYILAYVVALILFGMYCYIEKENMFDALAYNRPAGANAILFGVANVLTMAAAFIFNKEGKRKKILVSFVVYALAATTMLFILPETVGMMFAYTAFLFIGLVHMRWIDERKLFSEAVLQEIEDNYEQDKLSSVAYKYILWGILSLVVLFLNYWNM